MAKNNTQAPNKGVFEYKNTDPRQGRKVVNFTITGSKFVDVDADLLGLAEELVNSEVDVSKDTDEDMLFCRAEVTPFIKPEE